MPVVSVIVPVYKVEAYLRRCVDSVLAQTFSDFELILVDDGSPDGSGAICDEYAEKDARVRVIHKENGGVSSARNAGLDAARGDFILFVDSDDWIDPALLETALRELGGFDSVSWGYHRIDESGAVTGTCRYDAGDYRWQEEAEQLAFLLRVFFRVRVGWAVWQRLFRRSVIDRFGLRFEPGQTIGEDVGFSLLYMLHSRSARCLDRALSYYLIRPDSATKASSAGVVLDQLLSLAKCVEKHLDEQEGFGRIKGSFPLIYYELMNEALGRIRRDEPGLDIGRLRGLLYDSVWDPAYFREKTAELLRCGRELERWYGHIRAMEIEAEFRYYLDGRLTEYRIRQIPIRALRRVRSALYKH